ncbi:MAG: hypothetical protein LBM03_01765 [Erysipelotrichaceae bacterium]|jgi:hypothetical protein|nr:hypothetical protein [Erysipelotrichaceae bacterium]
MKKKISYIDKLNFKKELLIKAEVTIRFEHKESWVFLEPKIGFLDMADFEYPINLFKDFEILKVNSNNVVMRHLDTTFTLDLKTSQTFGEIIQKDINDEHIYGCSQISISLQ